MAAFFAYGSANGSFQCVSHPCFLYEAVLNNWHRRTRYVRACGACTSSIASRKALQPAAVAVSADIDLLATADPALDSLIDQWLSPHHAATSAPDSGSSGSNGSSSTASPAGPQVPSVQWEALMSPVVITLDSLSTLEDGDDLFMLSDSISQLAGSLQELQNLAAQLRQHQRQQQQQQQVPDVEDNAAAPAELMSQLVQLLMIARQQVDALEDLVLLNLLAVATVLLPPHIRSSNSSSSSSSSTSSGSNSTAAMQSAAAAVVQAALAELWQRPAATAELDPSRLTCLCVILRRLQEQGWSRAVPSALLMSAYQQLQQQVLALTPAQLAVCCWCLSCCPGAPPLPAVTAALAAAAAAVSNGQMDAAAVRRMSAAVLKWRHYLAAGGLAPARISIRSGSSDASGSGNGSTSSGSGSSRSGCRVVAGVAEYVEAAAQHVVRLAEAAGSSSSTDVQAGVLKQLTSISQLHAAFGIAPPDKLVAAAAELVITWSTAAAAAAATTTMMEATTAVTAASAAAAGLVDAATAYGLLAPYWGRLPVDVHQHALRVVLSQLHQQQQQQQQPQQQQQQVAAWSMVTALLQAAHYAAAAAPIGQAVLVDVLAGLTPLGPQQRQELPESVVPVAAGCYVTALQLLADNREAAQQQQQLVGSLCSTAVAAVQRATGSCAGGDAAAAAAVTAAAAGAAAALARLQLADEHLQQQLLNQLLLTLQCQPSSTARPFRVHVAAAHLPAGTDRSLLQLARLPTSSSSSSSSSWSPEVTTAASCLSAAALQQLLEPAVLQQLTPGQPAELLLFLTDMLDHHQPQQQQAGLAQQLTHRLLQQSLGCMMAVQLDARGLRPSQIAPVLAAAVRLQQMYKAAQQQQQQQGLWVLETPPWRGSRGSSFQQLQQEVVAAATLQLQDSARFLNLQQLSDAVRLLAQLKGLGAGTGRPGLALAAVVSTASGRLQQMTLGQLVWLLWGLTKLGHSSEKGFMRLVKAAVDQAKSAAADEGSTAAVAAAVQQYSKQREDFFDPSAADSTGAAAAAAAVVPLHQLVALLWVAACRSYSSPDITSLTSSIIRHPSKPSMSQVASLAWSTARLSLPARAQQQQHGGEASLQQQQQQQQQQQVLQYVEKWLIDNAGAAGSSPSSVVNIAWAMRRLGHQPSAAAQAALISAALQVEQQQQQQQQQDEQFQQRKDQLLTCYTAAELSCLLYCLASWGAEVPQELLEQLQQQLAAGLATCAAGAAGDSSSSSSSSDAPWDAAAVCSSCWALVTLGGPLQQDILQAAEQHLLGLLPDPITQAPAAAAVAAASIGGCEGPTAADLAMFGLACRQSGYQPLELLSRFRSWLLLQLARKGPAGLLKLVRRTSVATAGARGAAGRGGRLRDVAVMGRDLRTPGSSSSSSGSSSSLDEAGMAATGTAATSWPQQHQQHQQALHSNHHANALVCILMFLRHTRYEDMALLQQLEVAACGRPAVGQFSSRQLVMVLQSFSILGYCPLHWWRHGLPMLLVRHAQHLAGQDCVELLEVLTQWREQLLVSSNTRCKQLLLPKVLQQLQGLQGKQPRPQGAAGGSVAAAAGGTAQAADAVGGPAGSGQLRSDSSQSAAAATAAAAIAFAAAPQPQAPAGAAAAPAPAAAAGEAEARLTRPIFLLSGKQVLSLLQSMVHLKLSNPDLLKQALRRLRQTWADLSPAGQLVAVHAAGRLGYDLSQQLDLSTLLSRGWQQDGLAPAAAAAGFGDEAAAAAADDDNDVAARSASAACRFIWVFGNVGKHPGAALMSRTLSVVAASAAAAEQQGQEYPLREVSTALYGAAVLQELSHPAAVLLVQQLAALGDRLLQHPQLQQQTQQLGACMLTAQLVSPSVPAASNRPVQAAGVAGQVAAAAAAGQAAAAAAAEGASGGTPAGPAGFSGAAAVGFTSLPGAVQQWLMHGWRRSVLLKAQRKPSRLQQELLLCLRQLGLRCRANAVTPDACVCIDVAATSPAGDLLAVELLGPHNAAVNTQRPLGPARLKWRLLVARGYRVVVINAWQWNSLDAPLPLGPLKQHEQQQPGLDSSSSGSSSSFDGADMCSEKLLFLQNKLAGPIAAAVTAATAAAASDGRPGGTTAEAHSTAVTQQGVVTTGGDQASNANTPAVRSKLWSQLQRPPSLPTRPQRPSDV